MICNTYKAFFQTLGDGTRLELLFALKQRPQTVSELVKSIRTEQSNVSHQLRRLRELGFVVFTREGKTKRYALERKTIQPLFSLINRHVDHYYHRYCRCKGTAQKERWRNGTPEKKTGGYNGD